MSKFQQVSYPQMLELVKMYSPEVIWSDGDWEMSDDYWQSKEFIAWLYNSRFAYVDKWFSVKIKGIRIKGLTTQTVQ